MLLRTCQLVARRGAHISTCLERTMSSIQEVEIGCGRRHAQHIRTLVAGRSLMLVAIANANSDMPSVNVEINAKVEQGPQQHGKSR